MSDTVAASRSVAETGERLARLEQIADDTRRSLDRLERGIEKVNDRIDRVDERIEKVNGRLDATMGEIRSEMRSQFWWTVGLLLSLTLAMLAGFGTLFQTLSRVPHL